MMLFWIDLAVIVLGFFAAALLFWRIPFLPKEMAVDASRISVIIPARNEAKTLPLLLSDLMAQSITPHEIIVVNDESEDETEQIARAFAVRVVSVAPKPTGWLGKNWACQTGADLATGDSLLFLDADVRLSPIGLSRIAHAFSVHGALSVQPYHTAKRWYEQLAMVFNLVQVGANGSALPRPVNLGLFGPVIALSRADYFAVDGHAGVKSAVVEDMALAQSLKKANIPFRVFVGDGDVSFRMYPGGISQLNQGFTKNLATCAAKTHVRVFLLVALFIASITSPVLHLACSLAGAQPLLLLYGAFYAFWVVVLFFISGRIGRFHPLAVLLYPLPLIMFFAVFVQSFAIRLFRGRVKWKGRAIELER